MTKLQQIEQILRKTENDSGRTSKMLALSDHQWAALMAAVSYWKQEVKKQEDTPGTGVYEPCGVEGIDGIQEQLEESLEFVLEKQ